ncbi:MAG: nuclear transport factor 2 family protein [Myxococcota bacterium]
MRQTAMFVGLAFTMLTAVAGPARAETSAPPPSTAALQPTLPGASTIPTGREASDRLAILDLLHRYSHLADALETEAFGALFTPDARFTIVFPESAPGLAPAPQVMGSSRKEIVAALRDRHAAFRAEGVQRRHFLTNSDRLGPDAIERTGRRRPAAAHVDPRRPLRDRRNGSLRGTRRRDRLGLAHRRVDPLLRSTHRLIARRASKFVTRDRRIRTSAPTE